MFFNSMFLMFVDVPVYYNLWSRHKKKDLHGILLDTIHLKYCDIILTVLCGILCNFAMQSEYINKYSRNLYLSKFQKRAAFIQCQPQPPLTHSSRVISESRDHHGSKTIQTQHLTSWWDFQDSNFESENGSNTKGLSKKPKCQIWY